MNLPLSSYYKALSDDSRLRILAALAKSSFTVQELTQILDLSQSTVSHHLKILVQTEMVECIKSGTWAHYTLLRTEKAGAKIAQQFLNLTRNGSKNLLNGQSLIFENDQKIVSKLLDEKSIELKKFFDSAAPKWKNLRNKIVGTKTYFNELSINVNPCDDLLELGCGAGFFLESILPRAGKTIAVDYSESMLDAAKRNLNEKSTHVDFRLGYLEHLPVADNSIDIAVSHMVVSFLNNLDKAFSDTHRVLKNLGRIAIIESYATQTDPLSYPTDNLPRVPVSMIVETLEQVGFKSVTHKEIEKEVFLITGNK